MKLNPKLIFYRMHFYIDAALVEVRFKSPIVLLEKDQVDKLVHNKEWKTALECCIYVKVHQPISYSINALNALSLIKLKLVLSTISMINFFWCVIIVASENS